MEEHDENNGKSHKFTAVSAQFAKVYTRVKAWVFCFFRHDMMFFLAAVIIYCRIFLVQKWLAFM